MRKAAEQVIFQKANVLRAARLGTDRWSAKSLSVRTTIGCAEGLPGANLEKSSISLGRLRARSRAPMVVSHIGSGHESFRLPRFPK